jgi:SAM-dependent methyltransferase
MPTEIRFEDGGAYERYMGAWSQLAGAAFLDWLALARGLRWLDVGCGTGAFTEMVIDRCEPASITGVDPSEAQLTFARSRLASRGAQFEMASAMALPFADDAFDVAVMPLVIFFVTEPAVGVAEMARVVAPGGTVAAYAWDMPGGGFPYADVQAELRSMGFEVPREPSPDASRLDTMRDLWSGAGLVDVETRAIAVQRTFDSFDHYWMTIIGGANVGRSLRKLSPDEVAGFQDRLRQRLPAPDEAGRITVSARANAVKGRVGRA